jgi:protein gp37
MSGASTIEWTDATWNPTRGCEKISPGCKHCYAETFAERFRGVAGHPYEQGFDPRLVPDALGWPLTKRKPLRIFVNSMSDLHGDFVPFEYVDRVYASMALCRHHTFQVLTKRAERRREYALSRARSIEFFDRAAREIGYTLRFEGMGLVGFPLPNVWEGVSVEDRKYGVPRIAVLRDTPAAVRFLSVEPLLEDLGTLDLRGIDQVIVGAESGRGARAMNEDWVRSIRDQCAEQGVAFFYKQRIEGGRKVSLPLLDGRQWSEMPERRP